MLEITPEQMAVFDRTADDVLVARVAADVRRENADEVADMSDDDLRLIVRNGFARARSHGFRTGGGLAGWVMLMFQMAPNFDEHPAVLEILTDRRRQEGDRLRAALGDLPPDVWEAVLDAHDDAAWTHA